MAYTIIQVSRKSGIPHSKLKFWLKKGLFFSIYRDKMVCGILARRIWNGCIG